MIFINAGFQRFALESGNEEFVTILKIVYGCFKMAFVIQHAQVSLPVVGIEQVHLSLFHLQPVLILYITLQNKDVFIRIPVFDAFCQGLLYIKLGKPGRTEPSLQVCPSFTFRSPVVLHGER